MWKTIKSWFVAEQKPPTLEERHEQALRRANGALATFRAVADDLERASANLRDVSAEAAEIAEQKKLQAEAALAESDANLTRAAKVRDLVG